MSGAADLDEPDLSSLPEPVRRYLAHALSGIGEHPSRTRLKMAGRIQVGAWLAFEADWVGDGRSFSWLASAGLGRTRFLRVHDQYSDGEGSMEVRVKHGPRLLRAAGPDVVRSGAGRTALESVWSPAALLPGRGANWLEWTDRSITFERELAPETPRVTIEIDQTGALTSSHGLRWRDAKHGYQPFGAIAHSERTFGTLTIPSELSVGWGFGGDDFSPFFECEVVEAAEESN